MTFVYKIFLKSLIKGKEPKSELEPEFLISAPAPGGNLISAARLLLRNTAAVQKGKKMDTLGQAKVKQASNSASSPRCILFILSLYCFSL